jgi:hypothetical protein
VENMSIPKGVFNNNKKNYNDSRSFNDSSEKIEMMKNKKYTEKNYQT